MIQEAEFFKAEDMKHKAMNALDDSVSSMLTSIDKMKIKSAMLKGKGLINDKKQQEPFVFVDFLRELESIFESAMDKVNKGYSDEESDSDSY
jgi:hypothetical protein